VLSVIYQLASFTIAEGGRPATELRSGVNDEDTCPLFRKCGGRTEAGKSSANHDDEI